MALDWKKEISFSTITDMIGGKSKKGAGQGSSAYPSKTTMNLYQQEKGSTNIRKTIVVGVLLLVFIALFVKFGVLDQLALVSQKEAELAEQRALVAGVSTSPGDFDELKETYDAYMASYGGSADAMLLLNMIEQRVMPQTNVSAIVYADNTLTLTLYNAPLDTVGTIAKDLESQPLVTKANVTTATMQSSEGQNTVSTLVLTLVGAESEEK